MRKIEGTIEDTITTTEGKDLPEYARAILQQPHLLSWLMAWHKDDTICPTAHEAAVMP